MSARMYPAWQVARVDPIVTLRYELTQDCLIPALLRHRLLTVVREHEEGTINPHRRTPRDFAKIDRGAFSNPDIQAVHASLHAYQPTPLIELPRRAQSLGVDRVFVKDEGHRFGLKAFKALGASYAIYRQIKKVLEEEGRNVAAPEEFYRRPDLIPEKRFTFCTATDGNHGRGVAWVARLLKQNAVIYMPKDTVVDRIQAIVDEGAQVNIIHGHYDDAVNRVREDAARNGWTMISDTSWPGYTEIPQWIMAGYLTMFREIHQGEDQSPHVDFIFVQAGVGALAAAAARYYNVEYTANPVKLISVEPTSTACMLESIKSANGDPRTVTGEFDTIMAGLNCGTPSPVAWPYVKHGFDAFMTITDDQCLNAMRAFYYPAESDPRIIAGESGAAGLAAVTALRESRELKEVSQSLGLNQSSRVLLLNTEADTDADTFKRNVVDQRT